MTFKQYELYKKVESRETKIRAMGPPEMGLFYRNPKEYNEKKRAFIKAKNYLLTRMFSNCFYGEVDIEDKKDDKKSVKKKKNIDEEDLEDVEDQEIRAEKKKILPDLLKKEGGWISSEKLKNRELFTISPKFSSVLLNIIKNFNSKHVIYSFYKTKAGIQLFYSLLKHCGIKVEVFSGDVDVKKREDILNRFNSIDNRRGKKIKVLLVTEAGAEGISILECNNIHILESSPKENKTRQAIGRVIRYKSHELLPKSEQFVNIWRYWSIIPKDEEHKKLVDEVLYKKGLVLEKHFENFTKRLIRNSIEVKD
jgi:superfamily II DNA or RNA helicase